MQQVNMKLTEHLTLSSAATLSHSSELDGLRLTPHFTLAEMTKTSAKIENVPNEAQVKNLKRSYYQVSNNTWIQGFLLSDKFA